MADRIIVMDSGKVLFDDIPSVVFSHVGELEEVGLAAPQVTYIMRSLKSRGWNVRDDVTSLQEAADEIMKELGMAPEDDISARKDGKAKTDLC